MPHWPSSFKPQANNITRPEATPLINGLPSQQLLLLRGVESDWLERIMAVSIAISKLWNKAFLKKPLAICVAEEREEKLERNLSLIDLLAIGIGGTVGSGVFVLAGLIAHDYAGPGVVWSWLIAGAGCTFSAMSYAEMSCRIPSAGSSYAYVFHGLGELPAVIAAWCLCLEYGIR